MNESELKKLCAEWQQRLKLQSWNIVCKFARHNEIDNEKLANVTYRLATEEAVVRVLDQDDYQRIYGEDFPQAIEKSIVHELLHLVLAPLEPEGGVYGTQEVVREQIVNRLSDTLVALKRERIESGIGFVENPGAGECIGAFLPEVTL
jgi:hypothetical protein